MPTFNEIIAQLESNDPTLKKIDFEDLGISEITDDQVQELANALKRSTTIKSLSLRGAELSAKGIVILAESLKMHPSVKRFSIGLPQPGLDTMDWDAVWALSQMLESNTVLAFLDLSRLNLSDIGIKALLRALTRNPHTALTELEMPYCGIGDEGFAAIADYLMGQNKLSTLDLSLNPIENIELLIQTLAHNNCQLTSLRLFSLPLFTDNTFSDMLKDNKRLKELWVTLEKDTEIQYFFEALQYNKVLSALTVSLYLHDDSDIDMTKIISLFENNNTIKEFNMPHRSFYRKLHELAIAFKKNTGLVDLGITNFEAFEKILDEVLDDDIPSDLETQENSESYFERYQQNILPLLERNIKAQENIAKLAANHRDRSLFQREVEGTSTKRVRRI